ncbi:MAG: hypothetical protein ACYDA6_01065 [Solirubrobacteraceae bacterium]
MSGPVWTLEFYEEAGREPVLDFLRGLDELKEQSLAAALRNVLAHEGIGVCGSSWGKWVGGAPGIFEFRVRHDAATILRERGLPVPRHLEETHADILLRVFCHAHGKKVILLLAGYDKGKEPSAKRQNAEVKRAKARLTRWKAMQRTIAKQAVGGIKSRGKRRS